MDTTLREMTFRGEPMTRLRDYAWRSGGMSTLLQDGVPYREIHKQTGVSVTTIGRVARYLTNGNGGYSLAAERLKEPRVG